MDLATLNNTITAPTALQVYLLGTLDFDAALTFQRRLHYEISGDRSQAALVVCEHRPLITVGRQGSRAHILGDEQEIQGRQWRVRWVNRGGGCMLHLPGQLALYPILPLDSLGLGMDRYLEQLGLVVRDLLAEFSIPAQVGRSVVRVGNRPLAGIGVTVRHWISSYGVYLNVHPDLEPFRTVRWGNKSTEPMTSLERERRGKVRPSLVRERFVDLFQTRFGFARLSLFSEHPSLKGCIDRCRPQKVGRSG